MTVDIFTGWNLGEIMARGPKFFVKMSKCVSHKNYPREDQIMTHVRDGGFILYRKILVSYCLDLNHYSFF